MKPETHLWQWLKGKLSGAPGFKFERIENSAGRSTPDITYSWGPAVNWGGGGHGWIELKCRSMPKIRYSPQPVKIAHFTEGQKRWLRERGDMGGHCFLFLELGNDLLLYSHRVAHLVGQENITGLKNVCTWSATKKTFDTGQFLRALTVDFKTTRCST